MAVFYFNHKKPSVAFFFNAFFTAVTFAVILVFNDNIDDYLKQLTIKIFASMKFTQLYLLEIKANSLNFLCFEHLRALS